MYVVVLRIYPGAVHWFDLLQEFKGRKSLSRYRYRTVGYFQAYYAVCQDCLHLSRSRPHPGQTVAVFHLRRISGTPVKDPMMICGYDHFYTTRRGGLLGWARVIKQQTGFMGGYRRPVSYTHLTLPTKA